LEYTKRQTSTEIKMKTSSLTIGIVGLGQLGASIAAGLKGQVKRILGFDLNPEHVNFCINSYFIDSYVNLDEISTRSDIVIVATPVNHISSIVSKLLNRSKKELVVFDVGSTKEQICNELSDHSKRKQYVATHPMAGNTGQGPSSASKILFRDKVVYICDEHESSHQAIDVVVKIWNSLGAGVRFISSKEHDHTVAFTSHLPQLVSYAMANSAACPETYNDAFSCASSGFDSTTRLAKSSPSMWIPIVMQNQKNILSAINEMQHQLKQIETAIRRNDEEALKLLFESANQVRKIFESINQNSKTKSHEMQRF